MLYRVKWFSLFLLFGVLIDPAYAQQDQPAALEKIDVRTFGAVGDSTTDDTEALQRAINAGGTVYLSAGTYRITAPLVVNLDDVGPVSIIGHGTATLVMAGAGPALHLIGTHQGTAAPRTVESSVWKRQRMPLVRGFEIVGAHPEALGVRAEGTMQPTFSQLAVRNTKHAIHLTGRNRNVIISEVHLYENSGVGVYLDQVNLHQINITNSHISYNGGGGIVVRGSEVRNLHIGSCDIESNMAADGSPTANVLIDATEGSVREGAIIGSTIQHNNEAPRSANIRLIGRTPPLYVGRFTIADNVLSDVATNVHLKNARGVTITGNTMWQGYDHNLLVEGSSHILVAENLFERNPDYQSDARNGLVFTDSEYCTLDGIDLHGIAAPEASLVIRRSRWFNVTNCMILDGAHAGLLMEEVSHTRVSDCSIRAQGENGVALRLVGGQNNMVTDNLLVGRVEIATGAARLRGNVQNP